MNGIGGSGDFARNAFHLDHDRRAQGSIPASCPWCRNNVDHTEHDVQVIVTIAGLADLRAAPSPKQRAKVVIDNCAHPNFRPALREYYDRAPALPPGRHTPHPLDEAYTFLPN